MGEAEGGTGQGWDVLHNLVSLPPEKGPPAAAEGQPAPPWITIARQKRRGTSDQPPTQEDKPRARTVKSEIGKQAKAPERAQVHRANAFCLCGYRRDQPARAGA